jgi:broad specificity phosphatase PhoE
VDNKARTLVLVRHSLPEFVTGVPASQWQLSDEGRRRCQPLAQHLAAHEPTAVISSTELKAIETGQICSDLLGLPFEKAPGLHEHQRGVVHDLESREDFEAQVGRFFEQPDRLVFGSETADQAHDRFSTAIAGVMALHPTGGLAIVSHGTVMTLLIARAANLDPFPFWNSLGLPAFAVLSFPELRLLEVVAEIEPSP